RALPAVRSGRIAVGIGHGSTGRTTMTHVNSGWAWRSVLVLALLAGCAGQQAHREGMALVAEGRVEEGLTKLSQATEEAPANLGYRADLLRNREQAANRLLAAASGERAAGHPDVAE